MLKQEVVLAVQAKLKEKGVEASQKEVKTHLEAFEAVVVEAIKTGEDVKLKGFVD
ncbi:HU family DNA-binding protein, partial [Bacillus pumilus]|uniref:HU family DNA-binding protein n=1 Tax=Bacillus pumilus TaxID=1408 RepID=UPI001642C9B6